MQTTVELPQVQFLDKGVDTHAAGEARTNVKLLDAERYEAEGTHMEPHMEPHSEVGGQS